MSLVLVDVEATGASPFSGVMTEFGAVEFESRAAFHGVLWEGGPDPENPAKSVIVGREFDARAVMRGFAGWLARVCDGRPVLVSDNPAYDFQWVSYYFDKTLGYNPFGHSGRRISDFWAGLRRDFYDTQRWKKLRVTPHDHNPVNDAMGNAEALASMLTLAEPAHPDVVEAAAQAQWDAFTERASSLGSWDKAPAASRDRVRDDVGRVLEAAHAARTGPAPRRGRDG